MTPQEKLDAIKRICDEATGNRWQWEDHESDGMWLMCADEHGSCDPIIADCPVNSEPLENDRRFIALSRTAIPALVEAVEKMHAELSELTCEAVADNALTAALDKVKIDEK